MISSGQPLDARGRMPRRTKFGKGLAHGFLQENLSSRKVSKTRNVLSVERGPRHVITEVVAPSETLITFDVFVLDAGDTSYALGGEQHSQMNVKLATFFAELHKS